MPDIRVRLKAVQSTLGTLPAILAAVSIVTASVGGAMVVASTYAADQSPQPEPATATSYAALHDAGVTGENVSVGIVEPTGFDLDALGTGVVAARAFGNGKTLVNGGANAHGTAVARTVGRIAPDSDRYLAAFGDERDFRAAVEWLAAQDVDVVVIPASFYGKPGDGSAWSARAVQRLARDTVVVAAAGNVGTGAWRGPITPGEDGIATPRHQPTGAPVELEVASPRTQVWVSWSDPDARYSLRLVQNGTTVARSTSYPADAVPNAVIDARLRAGTYRLVVAEHRNGSANTPVVRIQTPTDRLSPPEPRGSLVAPATARGVLVVGAFDRAAGVVPRYSARGPTIDGRTGVDLVAPANPVTGPRATADAGTSYAAARAAGVAALMLSAAPDAEPHRVETALERSAWDIGPSGHDTASGAGLIRAGHAVAEIRRER